MHYHTWLNFLKIYYFICLSILPACVSEPGTYWRPEEGVGPQELELFGFKSLCGYWRVLAIEPRSFGRIAGVSEHASRGSSPTKKWGSPLR